MTCAPCEAASRVQASWSAIIDSLSPVQVAWVNATRTTVIGLLRISSRPASEPHAAPECPFLAP